MNSCKLDGCTNPTRGYGWCDDCRENWKRYGTPRPTCALPDCDRPRKEHPICKHHRSNLRKYGVYNPPPKLDAQPLLDYIAEHGGTNAVLARAGFQYGTVEFNKGEARILDAAANGKVTPLLADRIAVENLGVHPAVIWGDDWFLDVLIDLEEAS